MRSQCEFGPMTGVRGLAKGRVRQVTAIGLTCQGAFPGLLPGNPGHPGAALSAAVIQVDG